MVLFASAYTALFEAFPSEQWIAATLTTAAALIASHNIYRAWQGLLVIGLFTEQKTPPDSPYYKPPVKTKN